MSDNRDEGASAESVTAVERPSAATHGEGPGPLPEGTVLAGRYEVRRVIGRGGMGVVVEAFDIAVGVSVAIKVVRAEYAGERQWTERLAREVKLARKIQHPNVCRVFDFAQSDGRALLIMELASGGTLRSQLIEGTARARPLADRLADARAIAAGVAAIHAAGIVHRDLSTQNVLRMADGRAVVSDFGLATDAPDGTTSIHGGTVAYMAPEVLRGGRASFAADIWSLGAVIHEVVFGERLRWDPTRGEVRSSVAASSFTRAERGVLEISRACTALNPERRPRDAGEISARLSEAGLARVAWYRWRRRAVAATAAGLMVLGAVAGVRRVRSARWSAEADPASDPLTIVPTGEPEDWTEKARVLAEVPGRIHCAVRLPDHRTVRFVWSHPPRAEDVDTHTGQRRPSPLIADAYAEGCPSLSADGQRLVYAGHVADGRTFAFVSDHPNGRDAVAEPQIAEPSINSDPVWLSDGESFIYDVDEQHVAVFSMASKRSVVIPNSPGPIYTAFHEAIGDQIFVNAVHQGPMRTEIRGFQYPRLEEIVRWEAPGVVPSFSSRDGKRFYYSYHRELDGELVEVEPLEKRARLVGAIRGQSLEPPLFVEDGAALLSMAHTSTLVIRSGNATPKRVPTTPDIGVASKCGARIIATQFQGTDKVDIVWLDDQGKIVEQVTPAGSRKYPTCSADGSVIFYGSMGERPGIERCDHRGCRRIFPDPVGTVAISQDDRRLAFMVVDSGGPTFRWMLSDGTGPVHEITAADNVCPPIWASEKDVWVSLRKGHAEVWTEIDTDTNRPTGRTFPGGDCEHILPGARPVDDPVEIEVGVRTQLRLLPSKYLLAGS